MKVGRKPIYLMLGVGIVIGVMLDLTVSGILDPLVGLGVPVPTGESRSSMAPRPQADPNVVLVDAEQAQR